MLIHDLLDDSARQAPRREAFIDGDTRHDYGDAAARAMRLAGALRRRGIAAGSTVGILGRNSMRFVESYFALSILGAVAVPLNVRLAGGEVEAMLDDAGSALVLGDTDLLSAVAASRLRIGFDGGIDGAPGYESLIGSSEPLARDDRFAGDDGSLAHLCFTGGTTGRPKGVMLSHRNVVTSAFNKIDLGGFRGDDTWLHAAPLFHQADSWAAFSFTALGARHVFLSRFDACRAVALIRDEGVTATQLVPTMLFDLAGAGGPTGWSSTLRRVLYGSAPMPLSRLREAIVLFGPIFQHIYGQTESAGTMAATDPAELPALVRADSARLGSCGRTVRGLRLCITDASGESLPPDTVGRIRVQGDTVMMGYWNRPRETAEVLEGGWLDTGDLGRIDRDGYLFIADRARDVVITGGENVYSTEVEEVLSSHAAVVEAAVIGVPHERWGEAVTAVVVCRAQSAIDDAELVAHCREQLAGYKCPKQVHRCEALPRTSAGKVDKPELRRRYAPPTGRDVRE